MSWCFQHLKNHVPEMQLEAILHIDVGEPGPGTGSDINLCPGSRGELFMSGNKIGMQMGLKDMTDIHSVFAGSLQINIHVPLRIDDDSVALRREHIRSMR